MADPTAEHPVLRFVRPEERRQALDAIEYAAAMLNQAVGLATLEAWCYDLAANGVPYHDWPDLVAQRHARGEQSPGEEAISLERARRDSEAMGMVDYGEI